MLTVKCTYFNQFHLLNLRTINQHLGQLFVTPEMIAKKIKKMKDNKSPVVDGIPPKLLTLECQINV